MLKTERGLRTDIDVSSRRARFTVNEENGKNWNY